jgi:signal transduction histidine kinase
MACHPVGDHCVVLDDQDLRHGRTIVSGLGSNGFRGGDDLVKRLFRGKDDPVADEPEAVIVTTVTTPPEPAGERSFDELRTGFTAAVSHELRTPLARILALLDSAELGDADVPSLISQARAEVVHAGALIDEILFHSELESGKEIVALGWTPALPVLEQVADAHEEAAARAGVTVQIRGDATVGVPLRPRMLKIVAENLTANAIRYAGPGATFTLSVNADADGTVLAAADDGIGVDPAEVGRLFERFWRADSARASRGTGLGLAIVKHVVVAAGGSVDARGARGEGVEVRCLFPDRGLEPRDLERARVEREPRAGLAAAEDEQPAA